MFAGTKVTDAGLQHLKGLTQLKTVHLPEAITDAGLAHLQGLTQLQLLSLSETKVTDAALEQIKDLGQLKALFLKKTNVTDAGLKDLRGLSRLERLDLSETKVTDAGLEHLKGLATLKTLSLAGTQVSEAGVKSLQAALPQCKISKEPPTAPKPTAPKPTAQDKEFRRISLQLNCQSPGLSAVQYAVFDTDPVAAFKAEINKPGMRTYFRQRLERAESKRQRESERFSQMKFYWNAVFRGVTGDQLDLLTSGPHSHILSNNRVNDKQWIATKCAAVDGKPVCWCIPVEVKKGEQIAVNLTVGNIFDLGAAFDDAMREGEQAK